MSRTFRKRTGGRRKRRTRRRKRRTRRRRGGLRLSDADMKRIGDANRRTIDQANKASGAVTNIGRIMRNERQQELDRAMAPRRAALAAARAQKELDKTKSAIKKVSILCRNAAYARDHPDRCPGGSTGPVSGGKRRRKRRKTRRRRRRRR